MRHMGKQLEALLAKKGVTKSELGRRCGMSKQWVHEVCRSDNWMTSTVMRVAKALAVDPADLLPK